MGDSLRKELDESQDVFVLKNAWIDHLKTQKRHIWLDEDKARRKLGKKNFDSEKQMPGYTDIFEKWSRCQAWEKSEKVLGADDHEVFKTLFAKHQKANKAMVLEAPYLANLFGADGRLKDIEAWKAKAISTSEPYFMDDWLDTAFVKRVANNPFSDLNSEKCKIAKKKYDHAQQQFQQLDAEEKQIKKEAYKSYKAKDTRQAIREMKQRLKKKKATKGMTQNKKAKTKTMKKKTQNKKAKTKTTK